MDSRFANISSAHSSDKHRRPNETPSEVESKTTLIPPPQALTRSSKDCSEFCRDSGSKPTVDIAINDEKKATLSCSAFRVVA